MANIKTTDLSTLGKPVTILMTLDGVGFGYLIDGEVYQASGSYYATNAKEDVFPMTSYIEDGGKKYIETIKKITGYSSKKLANL